MEIWLVWNTPSLPLLLAPIWSGVVVPIRVPSVVQIDLFKNYSYLIAKIRMVFKEINHQLLRHWPFIISWKEYVQKNLNAMLYSVDFSKACKSIYRKKMEQILLAYVFWKETVTVIIMLYKDMKDGPLIWWWHWLFWHYHWRWYIGIISIPNLSELCTTNINRSNDRKCSHTKKANNILLKLLLIQTCTSCKFTCSSCVSAAWPGTVSSWIWMKQHSRNNYKNLNMNVHWMWFPNF